MGIQVHGGYGYIEETGAAQHLRDSRISPIYEGTNGIQAMDLVGRKLPMREGGVMGDLLAEIAGTVGDLAAAGDGFASMRSGLADALAATEEATTWLMQNGPANPNDAMAGATPYLRMLGQLVGGWLMARLALGAHRRIQAADGDADHLGSKIVAARFYAEQLLPVATAQLGAVTAGAGDLYAVPDDAFSA